MRAAPKTRPRTTAARPGRAGARRWRTRHAVIGGAVALAVVAIVLVVRSASSPQPAATRSTDFALVAYQGQDVLGGDRVRFSHVLGDGRPVVLNFFAGACAPCSQEMPGLQRVADGYRGRVIFVGVDVGPFSSAWAATTTRPGC